MKEKLRKQIQLTFGGYRLTTKSDSLYVCNDWFERLLERLIFLNGIEFEFQFSFVAIHNSF